MQHARRHCGGGGLHRIARLFDPDRQIKSRLRQLIRQPPGSYSQAQAADVLTNGAEFYEAELEAIRGSCRSVHIETFIFHPSAIADRFVAELVECARRGVSVRVVVDAIGSFPTPDSYFDALRQAGGESVGISPFAGTP